MRLSPITGGVSLGFNQILTKSVATKAIFCSIIILGHDANITSCPYCIGQEKNKTKQSLLGSEGVCTCWGQYLTCFQHRKWLEKKYICKQNKIKHRPLLVGCLTNSKEDAAFGSCWLTSWVSDFGMAGCCSGFVMGLSGRTRKILLLIN